MSTILVIEDEPTILLNIAEVLILEGYQTLQAPDGKSGIAQAVTHRPDLILCDIRMPRADGFEVLETLRQHPDTAAIPFIFLTAKTNGSEIEELKTMTTIDYLAKPFEIEDLLALIRMRLGQ